MRKDQCTTECLNHFCQISLRRNILTSFSSLKTFACSCTILSSCLSISLLATSSFNWVGVRGFSCFCFKGKGLWIAGGCLCFTETLQGKILGSGEPAVFSLLSKCRLQILEFSLTVIGFLMLTNPGQGLEVCDGTLCPQTLGYHSCWNIQVCYKSSVEAWYGAQMFKWVALCGLRQ